MIKRMLFGGAIESVVLQRFEDCSLLRQVPDHQEVFADACSDQSIIVEILQREEDIPDDQICQFCDQDSVSLFLYIHICVYFCMHVCVCVYVCMYMYV